MEKIKHCPMYNENAQACMGNKCAWWSDYAEQCAVVGSTAALAKYMHDIVSALDRLYAAYEERTSMLS